jgi:hypothetical protein
MLTEPPPTRSLKFETDRRGLIVFRTSYSMTRVGASPRLGARGRSLWCAAVFLFRNIMVLSHENCSRGIIEPMVDESRGLSRVRYKYLKTYRRPSRPSVCYRQTNSQMTSKANDHNKHFDLYNASIFVFQILINK